jgi:hypothetical protein
MKKTYTLFSKDRASSYPNLTEFDIKKSAFLKDFLEFQPNNYEIELEFTSETVFTVGQFLRYGFLDSMVSNYGHVIVAFDFLRLNEYIDSYESLYSQLKESPIITPKKLLKFLEMEIDIPENFPTNYRNQLFKLLKVGRKYFFTFLKLSPTNEEIQKFINRNFNQWDKIDMNQFIEELYKFRNLIRERLPNVLIEEEFVYYLKVSKNNHDEIFGLYEVDDELFDKMIIKYWENGSKLFPVIYYYYALQIIHELDQDVDLEDMDEEDQAIYNTHLHHNTLLKSRALVHIEYMETEYMPSKHRRLVKSCISCGKMAQFKTEGNRPIFVCSKICLPFLK